MLADENPDKQDLSCDKILSVISQSDRSKIDSQLNSNGLVNVKEIRGRTSEKGGIALRTGSEKSNMD